MSSTPQTQEQAQADPKLALQYLGEVASTYAETLKPVEKAPFINQVNTCLKILSEDRQAIAQAYTKLQEELAAATATED